MSRKHKVRIIPRLDIKGPNLVKGIHLEGLRVLGRPYEFAKYYYEHGADELFYQDVVASLYERNSLEDIISKTAKSVFIPITVGGGMRTLADIEKVLKAGADRVSINTAGLKNPDFINKAAKKFGRSTITVAIEAIKQPDGKYLCFVDNGREYTGKDALEWAKEVQERGAGEIILTSVDREGTGEGFDLELVNQLSEAIEVPLVVHGGAGKVEDVETLLTSNQTVDGVAIASILHYGLLEKNLLSAPTTEVEGNTVFLQKISSYKKVQVTELKTIKERLIQNQIPCRENP